MSNNQHAKMQHVEIRLTVKILSRITFNGGIAEENILKMAIYIRFIEREL